ncbi:MAG TPA: thiamine pyrophosphate-dependent enzyme [Planctomycetota bacterium]|nr:thiamine pyrophosphate-dependent enzyme [Planctomycetota bacterium]
MKPLPSPLDRLLRSEPGRTELLLGNEAILRGAVEAGVGFACGYPGTPSTEVTDGFAVLAPRLGIPFEYSVNEKIALETAFAACLAGARSIVAMKHLGLMAAGDPLSTIPYIGTVAGLVIVSAGDPSCLTSPNEQDQRHLADALHLPMLDPPTPQAALEATRFAFELSERCRLPVVLRPTTRVCHTSAPVRFGAVAPRTVRGFRRDPSRFLPVPANARRMRGEIEERLAVARAVIAESDWLTERGEGRTAVFSVGAPSATAAELLRAAGAEREVAHLSTSVVFPLPTEELVERLRSLERVLVVEELSPYFEDHLRALCKLHDLPLEVLGKRTGHLPTAFEYEPRVIATGLHEALGIGPRPGPTRDTLAPPERPPVLCAACPHRSSFFAARAALGRQTHFFNDIGCYTLGCGGPLDAGDALLCMGAGFSLAAGVARTTGERTVGFLGDSTFFHSGMPALLNAAKEEVDMVAVVLDNEITAMTGFQESPTTASGAPGDIATIARALGAGQVEVVDPHDLSDAIAAFRRADEHEGLSVVIAKRPCPVAEQRAEGRAAAPLPAFTIDPDLCGACGRSSCGKRCDQGVHPDYERALIRARLSTEGRAPDQPQVAPCAQRCPLYLCVQGYAAHIAAGSYADALELIMSDLPLPDSVCRVCHRPCEAACVRADVDEPVAVNDLKRFVLDWAAEQEEPPYQPRRAPDHGLCAAVVGAGPAGLAAAHELRLRGYAVELFDAAERPGGMLRSAIPAYRLPREALERDVERILALGVTFHPGRTLGADLDLTGLLAEHAAVVLALGAARPRELELAGEGPPVTDALAFLRDSKQRACSVLVIGGGSSAIDAARVALRRGAGRVRIACLEEGAELPAIEGEVAEALREGVELLTRARAARLVAGGVELEHVEPRTPGDLDPAGFEAAGPRVGSLPAPAPHTDRDAARRLESDGAVSLAVDLVITAVGQQVDSTGLAGLTEPAGEPVEIDPTSGATSIPRLFAAGDLVCGARTVTDAIASGLRAAWGLDRSLRGAERADERRPPPPVEPAPPAAAPAAGGTAAGARRRPPELDPCVAITSFDEVVGRLDEEQARAEAERCMVCGLCGNCRSCVDLFGCPAILSGDDGALCIDPVLCVGCGVCADFCPNGAIAAVEELAGAPQSAGTGAPA